MAAVEVKRSMNIRSVIGHLATSTRASETLKKPGSIRLHGEMLLTSTHSGSPSHSGDSIREPGIDWTNNGEVAVGPIGRPRLGPHTPRPRGK